MLSRLQLLTILSLIVISFTSCTVFKGEPPAKKDAIPPPDYNPIYMQSIRAFNYDTDDDINAEISSIDTRNLSLVKLKVHLTDDERNYLTGAISSDLKKIWCLTTDSINGRVNTIKNPNIYEVVENPKNKIAIALVLDHSGSMGEERAIVVQNAIDKLVQNKRDNIYLSIIKYDDKINTEVPFTNEKRIISNNFKKLGLYNYGGLTAIDDAIYQAVGELANQPNNMEKAVVVFTDGWDNSSNSNTNDVIRLAKSNNIMVCGVDFGDNINANHMKKYADSTWGIYKHIYSTNEFNLIFDDIIKRLQTYYVVEYNPKEFGEHTVNLKLCLKNGTKFASRSYNNTPDIGAIGLVNVYFDLNKSTIKKESEEEIEQVVMLMKAYPTMEIELRGHTDNQNNTGESDYNLKLSQKRADAVKQYMVKNGIDQSRIIARGYGDTMPIADNESEEGRSKNRRTEFKILKK